MNQEILDLIEQYDRLAKELEDQALARLDRAIDQGYLDLERELLKLYAQIQEQGSLLASQQKAVVMSELDDRIDIIRPEQSADYEKLFQQMTEGAIVLGGVLGVALLLANAPKLFNRPFADINTNTATLQARDAARRLYRHNEEFRGKVSAIVEQGLIQGWGARRVADAMRSEVGVTKFRAETIARTEVMSAVNDGVQLRYQQAGIKFVQWVVTPSEGLCPFCADRNMQVYPVGSVKVPAHPRCRCVLNPWSREFQRLNLPDSEFDREYRDRILDELEQSGKQPNRGVSPFEKSAGLERPPEPVWKPGDTPLAQPSRLPQSHSVGFDRYTTERMDAALNAIATPGATERVEQFRAFVQRHDIKAAWYDPEQGINDNIAQLRRQLANSPFSSRDDFEDLLYLPEGSLGATYYDPDTLEIVDYVLVRGRSAQGRYSLNTTSLNAAGKAVLREDADFFAVDDALRGKPDTQNFVIYLHEMGHQVHVRAGLPKHPSGELVSPTRYGLENDDENFAECFALWMLDAEAYRKSDPVGAGWIEAALRKATQ